MYWKQMREFSNYPSDKLEAAQKYTDIFLHPFSFLIEVMNNNK